MSLARFPVDWRGIDGTAFRLPRTRVWAQSDVEQVADELTTTDALLINARTVLRCFLRVPNIDLSQICNKARSSRPQRYSDSEQRYETSFSLIPATRKL